MNIVEYALREQRTFTELPFSEVDSLVLSSFSYFDFEGSPELLPTWESRATIAELARRRDPERMMFRTFNAPREEGDGLMEAMARSRRFASVQAGCVRARFSERRTEQFFAVSFFLPDGSAYLAFRGTDDTIAGWREDFELSFKDATASQLHAYEYACDLARVHPGGLRYGGHSKGGNLAEFAALLVDEDVFERILGVYDHEGPGFACEPSARMGTLRYNRILRKTVVKHSIIGMLFENRPNVHIVSAAGTGFIQHSPFYWEIRGGSFLFEDRLASFVDFFDSFFNQWVLSKSLGDRELITRALFEPLSLSGATTIGDALRLLQTRPFAILSSILRADPDARRFAGAAFAQLPSAARDELRERVGERRARRTAARAETVRRAQVTHSRGRAGQGPDAGRKGGEGVRRPSRPKRSGVRASANGAAVRSAPGVPGADACVPGVPGVGVCNSEDPEAGGSCSA